MKFIKNLMKIFLFSKACCVKKDDLLKNGLEKVKPDDTISNANSNATLQRPKTVLQFQVDGKKANNYWKMLWSTKPAEKKDKKKQETNIDWPSTIAATPEKNQFS